MKRRILFIRFILITYNLVLLYLMFAGFNRSVHPNYSYNIVPLHTISEYVLNVTYDNLLDTLINLAGNIGVFIPLGCLIPAAFPKHLKFTNFLIMFAGLIIVLEICQMLFRVGTGDIDDLLLNVIGGAMGYGLYHLFTNKD
ncbi:VanZ family protein [Neobacillus mesonae]|nr:VanZ family protein [Neobacillus mesonae]